MSTTAEALTIPLNKLVPWKGNVRRTEPKAGLNELAASITAHGLLQSLVVQKDKAGTYSVVAGRRRFLALQSLAKSGTIKATYQVPCSVMDAGANPTELSLAENFQREAMHPADEFEAFNKLNKDGLSASEIAARNGVSEQMVEKRLKLANVSPALIKEFRDGNCSLNHMMAFAVTTDHEAQERVWKNIPTYRRNDPNAIRDMLIEGEITAKDRRVKFVTLAAYEKAGGVVRRDLFSADEEGAFIADKELLETLVNKKLGKIVDSLQKEGWKWVELRESFDHSEWSRCSRRHEEPAPLPAKKQAELDALNKELESLMDDEDNPRFDQLQAKIDKIEHGRERSWQPDTLAIAGAVVSIGWNGKADITRGLVKPEDKPKAMKAPKVNADGSVAEVPDESPSLSAALTESLTTQRTAAIMAVLQDKPAAALRALVHTLASDVFYEGSYQSSVIKVSLHQTYPQEIEGTPAHKAMEAAEAKWKKQLPGKEEALWDWCFKQKDPVLLDLLAFCVSRSVDAIQRKHEKGDGPRFTEADKLAAAIGLDMTDFFKATAENFFGRVSKPLIMEALKEAKVEITPQMEKMKKGELAAIAENEVGKMKWLPTLLRGPAP
jgi:ParB family transcriptional regulator, chromosome partitioning protein